MNILGLILGLVICTFLCFEIYGIIRDCVRRKQLKDNDKNLKGGDN